MLPNGEVLHRAGVDELAIIADRIETREEASRFERSLWPTLAGRMFLGGERWLSSRWAARLSGERKEGLRKRAAEAGASMANVSAAGQESYRRYAAWAAAQLG